MKIKKENKQNDKLSIKEFEYHDSFTTIEQFTAFDKIIRSNSGEKEIDDFITQNPEILTTILNHFRTGHNGGWVLPKLTLTPRIEHMYQKGMIPDFILGGNSSDGHEWWIVELKGANEEIVIIDKNERIRFADIVNKGICQLLEYIDFASEKQSNLRESFGLTNFREPNGLLIIGRENEFENNHRKQKLKSSWNRLNKGKLEIRTYDFLLREFRYALKRKENYENLKNAPQSEFLSGLFQRMLNRPDVDEPVE